MFVLRPKCKSLEGAETILKNAKQILEKWLEDTQRTIINGLEKSLKLITNVKGLHLVREESLKIGILFYKIATKYNVQYIFQNCQVTGNKYA